MKPHTHQLEVIDHLTDIDDENKEVKVSRRCTVTGCEYWRTDFYTYECSDTPEGIETLAQLE